MVRPDRAGFRFVSAAFLPCGDRLGQVATGLGLTGQPVCMNDQGCCSRLVDPHRRAADDELSLAGLAGRGPLAKSFMRIFT